MATYDLTQTTPTELKTGDIINVPYSGTYKTITLPKGIYKLEVWGAQGGSYNSTYVGGKGGYSYGTLTLENEETTLYCYAGQQKSGYGSSAGATSGTAFNGGGYGTTVYYSGTYTYACSGGGGSDIRIGSTSLYARVIVAGGGSGSTNGSTGWYGGGITSGGYSSTYQATQTAAGKNGSFGVGANYVPSSTNYKYSGAGGGGGWYGGGADTSRSDSATATRQYCGGGSGYVYTSSTASNYPSGCLLNSAYYLTDATTVAGNTSFVDYSGSTVTGHSGNGCVRITVVKIDSSKLRVKTPVKYTKLSYIEGTGTQYIDTKFKANSNTRVVVDVENTHSSSTWIFGGRTTATQQTFGVYYTGSAFRHDYNNSYSVELSKTWSGRVIVDKNKNVLTVDGSSVSQTYADFSCDYPIWLFAMNMAGSPVSGYFKFRLYSCKIYDNDTLVRDFIPCKNTNGDIGLYDLVNNEFYPNKGTGAFAVGETLEEINVDEWKEGQDCYVKIQRCLTPIQYIQTTGTQYIDTGFKPNQNTTIEMIYKCSNTNENTLFGCDTSWTVNGYFLSMNASAYGNNVATGIVMYGSEKATARFENGKIYKNGSLVATITTSTFQTVYNLTLFALNRSGTKQEFNSGIFYSCKIWDNGTLIRDYIPVLDESNIPCLYDKITQQCFYNQGTGSFHYTKPEVLPDGYTQLEYIQSDDACRIDTGVVVGSSDARIEMDIQNCNSDLSAQNWFTQFSTNYISSTAGMLQLGSYNSMWGYHLPNVTVSGFGTMTANRTKVNVSIANTTLTFSGDVSGSYTNANVSSGAYRNNDITIMRGIWRCYGVKIYVSNALVRNFIPCKNPSGTIGLYDLINNVFYANVGTGVFAVGDEVESQDKTLIYFSAWKQAQEVYVKVAENLTVLDYIESTGTQYIDTGFKPNQDTRVVVDCEFEKPTSDMALFGARTSSQVAEFTLYGRSGGYTYGYGTARVTLSTTSISGQYSVDANKNIITMGNTKETAATSTFAATVTLCLFAYNDQTYGAIDHAIAKIYSCKIYDNETLVRDYIPVLDQNDVACLYDKVEGKCYYNAGTGTFAYQYSANLPEGYTQVSYIRGTSGQYIDLGYKHNQDTRVVIKSQSVGDTGYCLFGARNAYANAMFYFLYNASDSKPQAYYGNTNAVVSMNDSALNTIEMDKNKVYVNDSLVLTLGSTVNTFQCNVNMYLFAMNDNGSLWTNGGTIDVYFMKVYEGETLIRNLIPCKNESGVLGLYDLINNKFYSNSGTGSFIAGSIVEKPEIYQIPHIHWKQVI